MLITPLENVGTRIEFLRKIGVKGVIMDQLGIWVIGFQVNIGVSEKFL